MRRLRMALSGAGPSMNLPTRWPSCTSKLNSWGVASMACQPSASWPGKSERFIQASFQTWKFQMDSPLLLCSFTRRIFSLYMKKSSIPLLKGGCPWAELKFVVVLLPTPRERQAELRMPPKTQH